MFDDKNLSLGDELSLINKATGGEFARARVVSIEEKPLGTVNEEDFANGHERYESEEKMLEAYRSYYGPSVTMDTPVKMIRFELTKKNDTE